MIRLQIFQLVFGHVDRHGSLRDVISKPGKNPAYIFLTQFWFGTKIKTSLKSIPQNTRILDLTEKLRSQQSTSVLCPRQK